MKQSLKVNTGRFDANAPHLPFVPVVWAVGWLDSMADWEEVKILSFWAEVFGKRNAESHASQNHLVAPSWGLGVSEMTQVLSTWPGFSWLTLTWVPGQLCGEVPTAPGVAKRHVHIHSGILSLHHWRGSGTGNLHSLILSFVTHHEFLSILSFSVL